jgi:drug/metabolite transporter (DMT)-like permease
MLLPGLAAPPIFSAVFMLLAGASWAVYSVLGRGVKDPVGATAGNFVRSVPFTLVLSIATITGARVDPAGVAYAVVSGAITSGLGYVLWYAALPALKATSAATVQLSVPAIAALGGVALLSETMSERLVVASAAILGGIALTISRQK